MRGENLLSYFSAQTINYGDSKEPSRCCFGALEYSKHVLKWMDKRIFSYIFWERSGSVVECLTRDQDAAG